MDTETLTLTPDSPNIIILDDDARVIAYQVAGAHDYRQSLIDGDAHWSGAGIKGSAQRYAMRYKMSRLTLLADLRTAGLLVREILGAHGRKTVIIGHDPEVYDLTVTARSAAAVEIKIGRLAA